MLGTRNFSQRGGISMSLRQTFRLRTLAWPTRAWTVCAEQQRSKSTQSIQSVGHEVTASALVTAGRPTQGVDFTTLSACVRELQAWVPAKLEQVVMPDKSSLSLRLRTLTASSWLTLSWHPIAGRMALSSSAPVRGAAAEGYSLAELVGGQLAGKVLVAVDMPQAWERVACLRFALRPGEPPTHHLYCEIMARYSNVALTDGGNTILGCAYQVGSAMSSLRSLQTGRVYTPPPITHGVPPTSCPDQQSWRDIVIQAAALAHASLSQRTHRKVRGDLNGNRASSAMAGSDLVPASHQHQQHQQQRVQTGRQQQQLPVDGLSAITAAVAVPGPGAAVAQPSETATQGLAAPAISAPREGKAAAGEGRLVDGLVRAFHGVSPSLVCDMCDAAGVDSQLGVLSMTDSQWEAIWVAWQGWLQRVRDDHYQPCSDEAMTRYSSLGVLPVSHASMCELLEAYYGSMQGSEKHTSHHRRLTTVLNGCLKKARGKVAAFESQLQDAARADEVQRRADMITANLYRVNPGDHEVVVEDWDTGKPLTLELDPLKPATQVAEGLYRRARKLRRAVAAVEPLLLAARGEVEYLEEVEESLAQLSSYRSPEDTAALQEVQDELVSGKYMKAPADAAMAVKAAAKAQKASKRAAGKKQGSAPVQERAGFRTFVSPGGFQVLVGRNNKQNDDLSMNVARANDLWLHLRGRPGSHTVLRVPSGQAAPQLGDADVQFAADLAAYFSKGRDDLKCDVMVTRAATVKKPRGAKPGQVFVTEELGNVVARPANSVAARELSTAAAG